MNQSKNKYIEELVFALLEDILFMPRSQILLTHRIGKDLKMDSDDASFILIPELEQKLDIKVPREEWSEVWTVQDLIDLLKKYTNRSPGE